jgi:putative ABC transport system ATP-binding protein
VIFECRNLSLIYDQGKDVQTYALKNINLKIEDKGLIGIMGPSGSGKSSLLYSMAGLKKPTTGSVVYKDKDLTKISDDEKSSIRKEEFGFIFQKHFLIDYMSVLDNVLVPLNDNSEENVKKAVSLLKKLKIDHLANKKPHQISGGQSQRAAIARALIKDPKVIFADELTAALDHSRAKEVMNILNEYKKSALIVVVTHDPSILEGADRIINVWDGEIKL